MYGDYSPHPYAPCEQVLVLSDEDFRTYSADEIIEKCHSVGAVNFLGEDEMFWVVFENEPRRLWDFTERALRETINQKKAKLADKEVTS